MKAELIGSFKGGLVVSVQQDAGNPLNRPEIIAAFAQVAAVPGVVGLRLHAPENIAAVRRVLRLPVIGIHKIYPEGGAHAAGGRVWITPTFEHARGLVEAGAEIVAIDATRRPRAAGESVAELIGAIHDRLGAAVMADVSDLAEGLAAAAGADIVATTLSGYTQTPPVSPYDPPDLELIAQLAARAGVPVIAEGRFNTPALARQALAAGAHAVVVGSAITRPDVIAGMFVRGIRE
jgi:N-acylglucosamine-6-phosphate 2-epimerase